MTGASMTNKALSQNWGSLVVVIDPALFGSRDAFLERVDEMIARIKSAKRLPGVEDIFLPGENGDKEESIVVDRGFLVVESNKFLQLKKLAGLDGC